MKLRAGVFVTIGKDNKTRGCWGTIDPTTGNISEEIIENTVKAISYDYRFNPVKKYELPDIKFFISIIGELEPIETIREFKPSIHGLFVISGDKNGVVLPGEVKTAQWGLQQCINKAGIKKGRNFRMFRFRTVVFKPIE